MFPILIVPRFDGVVTRRRDAFFHSTRAFPADRERRVAPKAPHDSRSRIVCRPGPFAGRVDKT
jgi:hypothetical protein